jgi:hypothetical protein
MTWTHAQPNNLPKEITNPKESFPAEAAVPAPVRPVSVNSQPATNVTAPATTSKRVAFDRFRNFEALPPETKALVRSTQIGMEWLFRFHQPHGRFLPGFLPAVNLIMEGDHPLRQALATFVLARAARFTGDERYLARANQAILTLLSDTMVDPAQPGVRFPAQRSIVCNRLGMAGFIVMAINEVTDPGADLLTKSEELCAFIQRQQRQDGSLSYADEQGEDGLLVEPDGVNQFPGPALYGLILSQRLSPRAWKVEVVRKGIGYYQKWFPAHPNPTMVPWMTAACCEAYLQTKENIFCEFAFQMNDWLLASQYEHQTRTAMRRQWSGGFMGFEKGKFVESVPTIDSARYAQSLADCCRMIRQMASPDTQRYDRYRLATLRASEFLATLQFDETNTQHITAKYRFWMVGGYHPTYFDGNLRVDQSACGVSAMIQLLVSGLDR